MIERVLLVAWKGSHATQWVEALRAGGYTVLLEDTTGERAWRTAKERGIDAVIIDGQKKPSHGRQTGHALRDTQKTKDIPIIWTNLDIEDVGSVQTEVRPDICLNAPTDPGEALAALRSLAGRHPSDKATSESFESLEPPPDPTLHAHVHSLMGTPSYVAAWTERTEPVATLIDPDAISAERPRAPEAVPPAPVAKKAAAKKAPAKKAAPKKVASAAAKKKVAAAGSRKTATSRPAAKTSRSASKSKPARRR